MFRPLNREEIADFQQWARDNHTPGDVIQNEIHHPVIVMESMTMDKEAGIDSVLATDNVAATENS